jgi:hypothetical protein
MAAGDKLTRPHSWHGWCVILMLLFSGGCATVRVTDPYRTATEQFLMSEAVARSIDRLNATALRDRKVYLDSTYLFTVNTQATPEQTFLLGELRAKLLATGVRLVDKREDSQIIVEVRSGGVGVDRQEFLLGIPAILIPSGASGTVPMATPELAIIKSTKQYGYANVALVAYWADTGEWIVSSGPYIGRTAREDFWFFGLGPRTEGNIATTEKPR